MRFLADESCDFSIVRALQAKGHDVVAVCELSPRAEDEAVMQLALEENRILLTEDKDFGQLVYAKTVGTSGVIFIRFPAKERLTLAETVIDLVEKRGEQLTGSFVVVQPGRIRIGGTVLR